uniref:Nuclear receptor domain-containing protein n=1 Tax=Rhabditophanes sp. KR3021 TaxID=114890 RepID=A0AC35UB31_9BILA
MDLDDADKPCSSRQQSYSINSSETPSTTNMSICTVCGDVGNGLHYGVISCRSCNAFFRRSVKDEKAKRYVCRGSGSCVIELKSRCACRFCRFYKCLVVGMSIDAVQHPRDPNGTQSNRVNDIYIQQKESNPSSNSDLRHANRNANLEMTHSNDSLSAQIAREESLSGILAYYGKYFSDTIIRPIVVSNIPSNILSNVTVTDGSTINVLSSKKTIQGLGDSMPSTSKIHNRQGNENINFGQNDDQRKKSFSDFIKEKEPTFREFNPSDVDNLAGAELNGLSYMCEKMEPWKHFCVKERDILFKRFSVRKLALDHAYFASKHTQLIEENKFAMINYTYLSETATGFEKIGDSEEILKRKKTILRPTIDRMLNKCVKPMNKLNMKSAEILAMHVMLMWSQSSKL